jgi:CRP-like cAMP-binding protein
MSRQRISRVRPPPSDRRPLNRLLASLPAAELTRILSNLEAVPVAAKQVMLKRGDPIRHVFFPNGGVFSVTAMMKNGSAVEVATVGSEGMLGVSAFLGGAAISGESMLQVPSERAEEKTVERMSVDAFRRELERHAGLHESVARYSQGAIALMMQSTACMALHRVQERCCRWLLMTHDRIRTDQFTLSQEFLAMMLGCARPTVAVVAGGLQEMGLIRYTHARMTSLDRAGVEAASCECYATVKTEFDRLGL